MPVEVRSDERVTNYVKFWQKDAAKDNEEHRAIRFDKYTDVVNGTRDSFHCDPKLISLYQVTMMVLQSYTSLVGVSDMIRPSLQSLVDKTYFSRVLPFLSLLQGWSVSSSCEIIWSLSTRFELMTGQLARHEHYLASMMNLKPNARVLDVGCGVGGPAREICRFSDANIVGINNNDFQIQRAIRKTRKAGLSHKISFVKGDFMKLSDQFGENSFDAGTSTLFLAGLNLLLFSICHRSDLSCTEFRGYLRRNLRSLETGWYCAWCPLQVNVATDLSFKFGVYEWCMTDKWDPSIPDHKAIAHGIEVSDEILSHLRLLVNCSWSSPVQVGDGIPEMRTLFEARKAIQAVGFEILHEEDLAARVYIRARFRSERLKICQQDLM